MPPFDENLLREGDPISLNTAPPVSSNALKSAPNAKARPETERARSYPGVSPKSDGVIGVTPLPLDNVNFPEYSPTSKYPPSPTSVQAKLLELKTGKQTVPNLQRPMSARISRTSIRPLRLACSAASPAEKYARSPWSNTPRRPKSKKRISPRKKGPKDGRKKSPRKSPLRKRTPRTAPRSGQPATSPFMVNKSFTFPSVTVIRPEAKNQKPLGAPAGGLASSPFNSQRKLTTNPLTTKSSPRKENFVKVPSLGKDVTDWDLSLNLMPSSSDEGTKARIQDLHKDMDGKVIQLEALIAAQQRIQELEKANDFSSLKIEELTRQLKKALRTISSQESQLAKYKKEMLEKKAAQRGRTSPRYSLFGDREDRSKKGQGYLIKSLTPSPRLGRGSYF